MKTNLYLSILVFSLCACQPKEQPQSFSYSDYPIDTIEIDPTIITRALDTTEYIVEDCFSLEMKDGVQDIIAADVQLYNDRIYILDERENKTVFVYDTQGHLLHQLGQIGHARNEYVGSPTCLSINRVNGEVHVYERNAARLLVFDKDGSYRRSVRFTLIPERICVTGTGNYLCSFESSKNHEDKLALYSPTGEKVKGLIPLTDKEKLYQWNCFYTDNQTIYHLSPMTDYAVEIKDDSIGSVLKLNFGDCYVSEETMKLAQEKKDLDILLNHAGVQFVESVEITDSLIHISYAFNGKKRNYLQIRSKYMALNDGGSYYCGRWPGAHHWISEDKLIYIFSKEDVEQINEFADKTNTKIYNDTNDKIKKVLDGVIEPPVFVSVRIK